MGIASQARDAAIATHLGLTVKMTRDKLNILGKVEHLLNLEQKTRIYELIRQICQTSVAYHNEFSYPITLSGAICEKGLRTKNYSKRLDKAGSDVGELLRHFFAQSKDEQRWCATDEAMWEVDNCSADIKRSMRRGRTQETAPHTSTPRRAAASPRTQTEEKGLLILESAREALEAMRNGMECYLTRLARDAASGFTTYDDEKKFEGLWSFEEEYEKCVSGAVG